VLVPPGDDAGVRLVDSTRAIVETVDVITPLVDDPFTFGRIAAANSLSDIYAMGAEPFTALSILGYPACDIPGKVIKEILRGASSVLQEAGVPLMGGHCFDDREVKFGLSVTGFVDKDRILRSSTPEDGDILILTKPLGTGILTTALKGGRVSEKEIQKPIEYMCMLNKRASELALEAKATACTDVTGFGLIGHGARMVSKERVDLIIEKDSVPVFERVLDFAERGIMPAGAYSNKQFFEGLVQYDCRIDETFKLILFDPQTSGGLLISIKQDALDCFRESGIFYKVIGRFKKGSGRIVIV